MESLPLCYFPMKMSRTISIFILMYESLNHEGFKRNNQQPAARGAPPLFHCRNWRPNKFNGYYRQTCGSADSLKPFLATLTGVTTPRCVCEHVFFRTSRLPGLFG